MMIILGMTWKEMLRKRVMLLTLILTVAFLIAFWFIAQTLSIHTRDNVFDPGSAEAIIDRFTTGSFILMLGFFFGAFVIAFLAIFSSFSTVAGEAEQGVLQALLTRPLPRWKWYLGRWLGYVSMGVLYALILFISILAITKIHAAVPGSFLVLFQSFLLFASVVPLLISLSMLGSTLFSALGNGVWMTMLYGAGWLAGIIEKVGGSLHLTADVLRPLQTISGLMSLLMPADGLQRKMLAVLFSYSDVQGLVTIGDSTVGLIAMGQMPSSSFVVYAMAYTVVLFLLGMWRFNKKDL